MSTTANTNGGNDRYRLPDDEREAWENLADADHPISDVAEEYLRYFC